MKRRWNFDDGFFVAMCKWALRVEKGTDKECEKSQNLCVWKMTISIGVKLKNWSGSLRKNQSGNFFVTILFSAQRADIINSLISYLILDGKAHVQMLTHQRFRVGNMLGFLLGVA